MPKKKSPLTEVATNRITSFYSPVNIKDSSSINITEKFKTKEEKDKLKFIKANLGEPHPFDYKMMEELCKKFGLVNAVIDKISDFTLGGYMYVEGDDEAVELIENWMYETNFRVFLKPWFKEALLKGPGFLEMTDFLNDEKITSIKVTNSNNIYSIRDDYGTTESYVQYFGDYARYNEKDIIPLSKDEIIQLNINKIGSSAYGFGIVYSALEVINNFGSAQQSIHKLMKRKANSPIHVKVGNEEKEDYPSQSDIDNIGEKLTYMNDTTEWVTGPNWNMSVLDFGNIGDKFTTILDNDYKLFSYCFQVPETIMGAGNVAEGLAEVQMEGFLRRCNSYKEDINVVLRTKIFDKLLEYKGLTGKKYKICYDTDTKKEKNQVLTSYKEVLSIPNLSKQILVGVNKKLADALGIEYDEDKEDFTAIQPITTPQQKPKKDEEEPNEEKLSIGERYKLDKIKEFLTSYKAPQELEVEKEKCECKECEEAYSNKPLANYTLNEWLNFDLRKVKQDVLSAILSDNFTDLAAQNRKEIYLGKLSKTQIEKLRSVLYDGVAEGKTVNQIAEDIQKNVKLRDRYVLNEKGEKVLHTPKETRAKMITQTEITRLGNEGNLISMENKGIKNVTYQINPGACEICQPFDGKKYQLTEAFGVLPQHPGCKCYFSDE